jgi:hypothetical protein
MTISTISLITLRDHNLYLKHLLAVYASHHSDNTINQLVADMVITWTANTDTLLDIMQADITTFALKCQRMCEQKRLYLSEMNRNNEQKQKSTLYLH